jgi:hypothetical protein
MANELDNNLNIVHVLCTAYSLTSSQLKILNQQYLHSDGSNLELRRPIAECQEILVNILWALHNLCVYSKKLSDKLICEMRIMDFISTSIRIMEEITPKFFTSVKLILSLATSNFVSDQWMLFVSFFNTIGDYFEGLIELEVQSSDLVLMKFIKIYTYEEDSAIEVLMDNIDIIEFLNKGITQESNLELF